MNGQENAGWLALLVLVIFAAAAWAIYRDIRRIKELREAEQRARAVDEESEHINAGIDAAIARQQNREPYTREEINAMLKLGDGAYDALMILYDDMGFPIESIRQRYPQHEGSLASIIHQCMNRGESFGEAVIHATDWYAQTMLRAFSKPADQRDPDTDELAMQIIAYAAPDKGGAE